MIADVNKPHLQGIANIIYDGSQKGTLEYAVQTWRTGLAADPDYKLLYDNFGKTQIIGTVTRHYQTNYGEPEIVSSHYFGFTFNGFKDGEPVISRYIGQEVAGYDPAQSSGSNNFYNRQVVSATFTPNNSNQPLQLGVSRSNAYFPEGSQSGNFIVNAANSMAAIYQAHYSPRFGSEVSRNSLNGLYTRDQWDRANSLKIKD